MSADARKELGAARPAEDAAAVSAEGLALNGNMLEDMGIQCLNGEEGERHDIQSHEPRRSTSFAAEHRKPHADNGTSSSAFGAVANAVSNTASTTAVATRKARRAARGVRRLARKARCVSGSYACHAQIAMQRAIVNHLQFIQRLHEAEQRRCADQFAVGRWAKLHGLQRADLNGCMGIIIQDVNQDGRVGIRVQQTSISGMTCAIKTCHLTPFADDELVMITMCARDSSTSRAFSGVRCWMWPQLVLTNLSYDLCPVSLRVDKPLCVAKVPVWIHFDLPLVDIDRVGSSDNVRITRLMTNPETGEACARWHKCVGSALVWRKNSEPFSGDDFYTIDTFCCQLQEKRMNGSFALWRDVTTAALRRSMQKSTSFERLNRAPAYAVCATAAPCPRARCLSILRVMLGNDNFLRVASFVPMSCLPGLTPMEEAHVAKAIRNYMREDHWLTQHMDEPDVDEWISSSALAQAIEPTEPGHCPVDANGAYALLALRDFKYDLNWTALDSDSTPLCAAIAANSAAIVALLLKRHADPNGYQSYSRDSNGTVTEKVTPLFMSIQMHRTGIAIMLLQARGNPHAWGFERQVCLMNPLPYGMEYFDNISPLRAAVDEACTSDPTSQNGVATRAILRSLLFYRANPNDAGRVSHLGHLRIHPYIDVAANHWVDPLGYVHSEESLTTPLEAAARWNSWNIGRTQKHLVAQDRHWSTDVVQLLEAIQPRRRVF